MKDLPIDLPISESSHPYPTPEEVIPHRAPMLFLGSITHCDEESATGHYLFDPQDPIFGGHFPDRPIVPGVLLLEGAAQTLAYWALRRASDHLVLLTGVDRAKWSHPVYPGEKVSYQVKVVKSKLGLVIADVIVHVNDKIALSASLKGYLQSK